ncbi:MAG: NAD-dependent epimerase/dehydratase family protein [Thermoleophilia bacterium]|nr:NAD-dependent epimerase/dehydratase family protein [Thermoleophilia bacterium]
MADRVVVTGGAGFIGSTLADALVARGDDVHVIDNLATGRRDQVPNAATFHELDISDVDALHDLAAEIGPIARWYHLAAQADVRVSVTDPAFDARVNVIGTIGVLRAARLHDAIVIFASTGGAIYGECSNGPAPESTPELPESPYGAAKLAAEVFLGQDARLYGGRHTVMRYANVYGPRQDPHGEAGVVAIFGGRVLRGEPARIFGDGTQTRDYVYVGDVVAATIAAADAAADGSDADLRAAGTLPIYNIGTGNETSVLELWDTTERAAGTELGREFHAARDGEVLRSVLDASHARTRLGVTFDTPLEQGLKATIEWLDTRVEA